MSSHSYIESGIWRIKLLAFDHEKNDSNIIGIYQKSVIFGEESHQCQDIIPSGLSGSGNRTITVEHFLFYKINGGNLIKINLGITHTSSTTWDVINNIGSMCDKSNVNQQYTNSGQVIYAASCQIHKKAGAMVATYLISGSTDRRVVIIHIKTGFITILNQDDLDIHDIDDRGVLKWKNPAGIGLYKLVKEK